MCNVFGFSTLKNQKLFGNFLEIRLVPGWGWAAFHAENRMSPGRKLTFFGFFGPEIWKYSIGQSPKYTRYGMCYFIIFFCYGNFVSGNDLKIYWSGKFQTDIILFFNIYSVIWIYIFFSFISQIDNSQPIPHHYTSPLSLPPPTSTSPRFYLRTPPLHLLSPLWSSG